MRVVLSVAAVAACFVWLTGASLPPTVISRFDTSGAADAYMSRESYLGVMIAIVILIPVFTFVIGRWVAARPEDAITIPNKSYWLAPERRAESLAYIAVWLQGCSFGVTAFVCYVHWLVVRGNSLTPPQLESTHLYGGMMVALIAQLFAISVLVSRFRRVV